MPVLSSWAARIVEQREALAPAVRERLDIHILDTIGALIAGHETTEGRRILSFSRVERGAPALLTDHVLDRIATRVALVRHTEVDDIDIPSCVTPGAVAIVSALTLAEDIQAPPDLVANAILSGYRVMTDLGRACGGSALLARGFWPTYVVGPLGAAAVTATILRLDEPSTTHAMALALAQTAAATGGPAEPNPRWLLLGLAARAGVAAAMAAARGLPGDPTLLDGDWLTRCHGIPFDRALLAPASDDVMAGMSIKAFASAKQATCAVNAFQDLCAEHKPELSQIKTVRAHVMPEHKAMIGHDRVTHSRSARLTSVPHLFALAACDPDQLMDIERGLHDTSAISALRGKVSVAADPSLAEGGPQHWPARVEIELLDGRVLSKTITSARGDPGWPFSIDDTKAKFARLTKSSGAHRAELVPLARRWLASAGCALRLGAWIANR